MERAEEREVEEGGSGEQNLRHLHRLDVKMDEWMDESRILQRERKRVMS